MRKTVDMDDRDPRSEELNNLRTALATFALQLDAFEARLKGYRMTKLDGELAKLFSLDIPKLKKKRNKKYLPRLSDRSS